MYFSWTKWQLYHSNRVGAGFPGCPTWGIIKCMRSVVVKRKSYSKYMSDGMLACKQMYKKNWLHCFEVKRTLISKKIELSVLNGVRSGFVKVVVVRTLQLTLLCSESSWTHHTQQRIKKIDWWWRIHVKKWIESDRFHDNWVNKWGPTTMAMFAEAEEWTHCHANKWSGILQKWQDLGLSNTFLKDGLWREHKCWQNTVGKAPKPSTISSIGWEQVLWLQWVRYI